TKKGCIEHLDTAKGRSSLYIIWIGDQRRVGTRRQKLPVGKKGNGLDPITQILPILVSRRRSRESTRQAYDRNINVPRRTTHLDTSPLPTIPTLSFDEINAQNPPRQDGLSAVSLVGCLGSVLIRRLREALYK